MSARRGNRSAERRTAPIPRLNLVNKHRVGLGTAELVALAELVHAPVATSLNGKDCIPGTHPLCVGVVGTYSRESANLVVNRADLVCFVGTETGGMTTNFWKVPKIGVAAVQLDIDPQALGRNYPLKAAVLGDAKKTLASMRQHTNAGSASLRKGWLESAPLVVPRRDYLVYVPSGHSR